MYFSISCFLAESEAIPLDSSDEESVQTKGRTVLFINYQ